MKVLPLEGIRVINFGAVAAAPAACRVLSDFGAEVLRAESVTKLDMMRKMMPLMPNLPPQDSIEVSTTFLDYNRNVRSFLANLKNAETVDLMKKLIRVSDVVVENFSVGTMSELGLDYDNLKEVNPGIIMLSLSAMGQTGPYNDMMTYGPTVTSASGAQSMLGYPDGEPAMGWGAPDHMAAMQAAFLIMGALLYRKRTGKGQFIDMAQVSPTICTLGEPLMDFAMNGRVGGRQGNRRPGMVPHNNYPCKGEDQWVSIAVETEEDWQSFREAIGNPSWTKEERFADRARRWNNQDALDKLVGQWTVNMTPYEATAILQNAGIAAAPFMDADLVAVDPHHIAREAFAFMDTPKARGVPFNPPPLKMSDSSYVAHSVSMFGEATDYVYGELLGLSNEEIERLKKGGAIM